MNRLFHRKIVYILINIKTKGFYNGENTSSDLFDATQYDCYISATISLNEMDEVTDWDILELEITYKVN